MCNLGTAGCIMWICQSVTISLWDTDLHLKLGHWVQCLFCYHLSWTTYHIPPIKNQCRLSNINFCHCQCRRRKICSPIALQPYANRVMALIADLHRKPRMAYPVAKHNALLVWPLKEICSLHSPRPVCTITHACILERSLQ